MIRLPIDADLPRIVQALRSHKNLVLVAPPGAGKTTRVPPAIIAAEILTAEHPNLMMLQPRRVAARAAAARIADEQHWEIGGEVGYHVRFDRRIGRSTRIRVVTEGILNRQLQADPFCTGIGAVLLDEFHERSIHSDLAVALLREVQQTVRPDLLLLIMSATLEAGPASKFLGDCPIVQVDARPFPVDITYLPRNESDLVDRVAAAVSEKLHAAESFAPQDGDTLVFLPGAGEIARVMQRLVPLADQYGIQLLPLHGTLPATQQQAALRPGDRPRIICATNVAETSLTIPGVTQVIDAGMARVAGFDPRRGLDRLDLQWISKASAVQRAGRAGRTARGHCIRLYSAKQFAAFDDFTPPEIQRVDLAPTILTLADWGRSEPQKFGWYEAPAESAIAASHRLLALLGAISSDGAVTPLGRRMANLPVHPRLARLLIAGADAGVADEAAALAALLSEKDISTDSAPRRLGRDAMHNGPTLASDADWRSRLDQLAEAERARFDPSLSQRGIDFVAARQAAQTRDALRATLPATSSAPSNSNAVRNADLARLLLLAYPDRVCRRRKSESRAALMVGGTGVTLGPQSQVQRAEFFLALDVRDDDRSEKSQAIIRIASEINPAWLEADFPQAITRRRQAEFDSKRRVVIGSGVEYYLDLPIREDADAAVDPAEAGAVLAAALAPEAEKIFAGNPAAAAALARVALLRTQVPEYPWPAFDAPQLIELLKDACAGKRSAAAVEQSDLAEIVHGALPHPLDRLLAELAPTGIQVPSGNTLKLDYALGKPPILAVRLQELFGWTATPKIARGRVPVLLHLLAPNFRPVQITNDLESFFRTTYHQVRKDLRRRYPKHDWPEDPFSAIAKSKGSPRNRA